MLMASTQCILHMFCDSQKKMVMKKNFYKPYLKFTEDHFQRMPRAFHVGKFSYAITVVLNYQLLRKLKNRHISLSHTMWLGKKIFSHLISRMCM